MTEIDADVKRRLGDCRVLGMMRIKNEAEWIRQSIESQLPICDKILVLDDHSTDSTRDIVRLFGDSCVLVESPFEGFGEGRDKRFLLDHALAVDPEWVIWIDGDEVLERQAPMILRYELQNPGAAWYAMRVLYFWNTLDKIRVDGCYANFSRGSVFRVRHQPHGDLHLVSNRGDTDLHCGSVPKGLVGTGYVSGARIKHYGYLYPEQRQRKFEWYNKIDPNNNVEDCYRHVIETPGAHYAPGPTVLEPWQE